MQNDKSKIRTNLPKISIIIPSFNKGKFIRQTLKSIVDQDYEKVEVIICDGGSSDNSLEIIKEFAKKYYYFSWVSKKDKGQVDAINKGMQKAIGEILTYINADDVYEKNAFEKIVHVFQKNPEALWFAGRGKVINQEGDEIAGCVSWYKNVLLKLNTYTFLLVVNYLMQPSVFITKKAYEKYGPFSGERGVIYEYDMWLKLGKQQMPIVISKTLSSFRLYSQGFSSTKANLILQDDEYIAKKHTNNKLILLLHRVNNYVRLLINRTI